MFSEHSCRKVYASSRRSRILIILCLIQLTIGNQECDEYYLSGAFEIQLNLVINEFDISEPDSTYVAAVRILHDLIDDEFFLKNYLQSPSSQEVLKNLIQKASELPFDRVDLITLILKVLFKFVNADKTTT